MPFRELTLDLENKQKNIGLGIDVTQKCQAQCPTCFYEGKEQYKDMPLELFEAIVDEAERSGFQEIYLLGGEPTLHKDIFGLLEYVLDKDSFNPVILVTNGLKLADREFCKELSDKGVMVAVQRHVIADLENPDNEPAFQRAERIQDTVMGVEGTLPVVNKAFTNIEQYFSPDKVAVQCCITRPVLEEDHIYNVFKYAREHGFEPVIECTKAGHHFIRGNPSDVSPEELLEVYRKLAEIDAEKYPALRSTKLTPQAYGKTCHMPETGVHVLIDGTAVPCVGQPYSLGKIPADKLDDILKSEKRKFFQYPENRIEGHCNDECGYLEECTGGCRGDAYYITGCFNASAIQCPQVANYSLRLAVEDFVPRSCTGCEMEGESACGIKPELKETLAGYLGSKFACEVS